VERSGGRLGFRCYDLVSELGVRKSQLQRIDKDRMEATGHVNKTLPVGAFGSKPVCLLEPINGAVLLADDVVTFVLLGWTACGLAMLLQTLWLSAWKKVLGRSGAYGSVTLVLRLVGQVVGCGLGGLGVLGVAWGVARVA